MSLRIHHLQHVPFEGLGSIEPALSARGHRLSASHLYRGDSLPAVDAFDWLIVMGGPMGVHDESLHPWLAAEKGLIRDAIAAGRSLLGICLGAQLIAQVLGAAVTRNAHREIGWFPVERSAAAAATRIGAALPPRFDAFHWHGDTFALPPGAVHLARSEACANQGFVFAERVVGLQFHLETTPESARALIAHGGDELDGSRYVQAAAAMLAKPVRFAGVNRVMGDLLAALEAATAA